jgi:glycosyltransferase involved in cell wall biosynthesis
VRIALIGAGSVPIPPIAWGAVEDTIWCRKKYLEQLGHRVDIYNTRMIHEVMYRINRERYDFIHCHSELFILSLNAHLGSAYALTSHFGGLYSLAQGSDSYPSFRSLFLDSLTAPANIVLSDDIRDLYLRSGYKGFLRTMRNAVEVERFHITDRGNGKAICLGRVIPRKRQELIVEATANQTEVDFVGPWNKRENESFQPSGTAAYLGVWNRTQIYERLSEYSCLVLLSHSEGAPKVVLEALAAGVSVVISEACSANLTSEEFITVLPEKDLTRGRIQDAIRSSIDKNERLRKQIREYAIATFDYSTAIQDYLAIVQDCHDALG